MLTSNNVATLTDENGKHDIEVEINKGGEIRDYVEFRVKDKDDNWIKSYVKIPELYGLIWMLADEKTQQEMMPVKQTQVKVIEGQHRIRLGRNMKKGEIVVANYRVEVPVVVYNDIKRLVGRRNQTKSGILIPR